MLTLSGAQIKEAMERSLGLYPRADPAFLQVSGISVRFDSSRPAGQRVLAIRVGSAEIEPGRSYQTAMPIALARGSAGYFRIWNKEDVLRSTNTRVSAAVISFVQASGKLDYKIGDRIAQRGGM